MNNERFNRYLLSRMYPSTLWSSFPKRPQGLNVMLHLSPVLPHSHKLLTNPLSWKLSSIHYPHLLLKLSQFCCLDQYAESDSKCTLTLPSWDVQVCQTDWRRACFHRQQGQQKAKELLLLMVDDLHVAILLNPQLTHDDVVHTACGVCPGVGLIVSMEKNAWGQWGMKEQHTAGWRLSLPGQLQRDHTPGLSFYALPPKLEFGVNGAVEHKILLETLSLKGTDWGVMANLLWHPPEAQVFSAGWDMW